MASLGEMTAGIAHEIQNPLNFVNNFSEVNSELLEEMENDFRQGKQAEGLELAADIRQNMDRINHHGKRADAIVRGMLQHSMASTGQKEPTDINALAEEYLRLSFHGMKAKDKSFHCEISHDLDEGLSAGQAGIEKIDIIPQDMGRVFLNLFNNAFYSVAEKKKKTATEFEPIVSVRTRRFDKYVEIVVRDNGIGIPQKIIDKIFQPFFTTKPTGQGTGLGLSLTYDIITKEHGGQIKVETEEGEYAEFIIHLPIQEDHKNISIMKWFVTILLFTMAWPCKAQHPELG